MNTPSAAHDRSHLMPNAGGSLRWVNILGIPVHALTYDEMASQVCVWLQDKSARSRHIACLNAYCLTLAAEDPTLADIYRRADIAGPDGMPFVYWIRARHRLACDRFYAPDIVLDLARRVRKTGHTFFLYGGAPDVVVGMKAYLEKRFPDLRVVGFRSPPFRPLTPEEDEELCREVNALRPDILCVGLGTPKQDYWIASHLERIRGTIMISAGATFDFMGGRVRMSNSPASNGSIDWPGRIGGDSCTATRL
jgi:N-acetylglucosaminyldiphosphoundecaprenol N-acetyl-beta-D-mannosaminyltransferase